MSRSASFQTSHSLLLLVLDNVVLQHRKDSQAFCHCHFSQEPHPGYCRCRQPSFLSLPFFTRTASTILQMWSSWTNRGQSYHSFKHLMASSQLSDVWVNPCSTNLSRPCLRASCKYINFLVSFNPVLERMVVSNCAQKLFQLGTFPSDVGTLTLGSFTSLSPVSYLL